MPALVGSRIVHMFLALGQLVSSAIVMGLFALFLWKNKNTKEGPRGRQIYVEIVSTLSLILSFIFFIPFTHTLLHWPVDFIMMAAMYAAFGISVNYISGDQCALPFKTGGERINLGRYCAQWKAAEAFLFLSAFIWFVSMCVGIYVKHVVSKGAKKTTSEA